MFLNCLRYSRCSQMFLVMDRSCVVTYLTYSDICWCWGIPWNESHTTPRKSAHVDKFPLLPEARCSFLGPDDPRLCRTFPVWVLQVPVLVQSCHGWWLLSGCLPGLPFCDPGKSRLGAPVPKSELYKLFIHYHFIQEMYATSSGLFWYFGVFDLCVCFCFAFLGTVSLFNSSGCSVAL